MTPKFRIIADSETVDTITLHPQQIDSLGIQTEENMHLIFGIRSRPIRISTSSRLQENQFALSQNLITRMRIPLACRYEVVIKSNKILLGPYFGFLVTITEQDLRKNLNRISTYLYCYREIGGVVAAFSLSGTDTRRRLIKGYVFNPKTNRWDKGVYTYPASFFIKSRMLSRKYLQHFHKVLGNTIFNNFNFDKWEMYKLLHASGLGPYLPPSGLLHKRYGIGTYLREFNQVFCKPVYGSRGKSVMKITKSSSGYLVRYREDDQNRRFFFTSIHKLNSFLRAKQSYEPYMVQKAINLISYRRRVIDFRIIMAKNHLGEWQDVGLFSRYGKSGSIVSNISAGGRAERGEKTLRKVFALTDKELVQMRQKLSWLAHQVASSIDATGVHCGNMGVDIGIDVHKNIWIIEVQHNNPDPTLILDANDDKSFLTLLRSNMLYLKRLAGFIHNE